MEDWIIPCNPETYDLFGAFDSLQTVDWRQRAKSMETSYPIAGFKQTG